MASLYKIDERFETLVDGFFDTEDGEILEGKELENRLDEVEMELDKKISNIACFIKNLNSDAEAIKQEKLILAQRQKVNENKSARLKNYLDTYLKSTTKEIGKYKFEDARCKLSYRKSSTVEVTDIGKIPSEFIKPREIKETDVMKTEIKNYLKLHSEETVNGVKLQENLNLNIK